jgi:DNA-binding transcriptional ArsR family regulator
MPEAEQELPEVFELGTLEQLRALADARRMRVIDALTIKPMTVTQLGEYLGEAPAKMHYHVHELEDVGLVKLVETRPKSGILEKYYRAVAKSFRANDMLLRTQTSDETLSHIRDFLEWNVDNFVRSIGASIHANPEKPAPGPSGASAVQLWVTPEEGKQFFIELDALLNKYGAPRGNEDEQERTFVWMLYDPRLVPTTPDTTPDVADIDTTAPNSSASMPRTVHSLVIGAAGYSRKELERTVSRGERLDLNIIGACSFADDIPPELVEQAIGRFRHRGLLHASDRVRETLKLKTPTKEK